MENPNLHQVGGDHYASKSVQPWEAMESWMSPEAFSGYLQGNCIKYLSRYRDKNGIEDLKKAQHYLSKLIAMETIELVSDNLNAAGENMRKSYFESGYQAGLHNTPPVDSSYIDMDIDWRRGYLKGRAESVMDRHAD
jgi:hypothetical protein